MHQGNLVLTFLGTAMLWVGWFGFNGGSAGAASAGAAFACLATQLSASVSAIVWTALDVIENGKVSVLGLRARLPSPVWPPSRRRLVSSDPSARA